MSGVDYLNSVSEMLNDATGGVWSVVADDDVDTAWIVSDKDGSNPVALLDYNAGAQNRHDAYFIVRVRNNIHNMISEIQTLRRRVDELLENNAREVELRISLQSELKKIRGE